MRFKPSGFFVPDDQLGAPVSAIESGKYSQYGAPSSLYIEYGTRTSIDYANAKEVVSRHEYMCHGKMAERFADLNNNAVENDPRPTYTITHLTKPGMKIDDVGALVEWHQFVFDPKLSPWRDVLPAFTPVWDEQKYLRAVVCRDLGQNARKIVNFLIGCRYPTYGKDYIRSYAAARNLGASIPEALLVSQLVYLWRQDGAVQIQPFASRDNRFWFTSNSVPKFFAGHMGGQYRPMARRFQETDKLIGHFTGVPNNSVWNHKGHKFEAHYPTQNPFSYTYTMDYVQQVLVAIRQCADKGVHSVDFKDCYSKKERKNTWDKAA